MRKSKRGIRLQRQIGAADRAKKRFHSQKLLDGLAQDNIDAADRVLADIHTVLRTGAASPHIGHRRLDLTARPLRFHVARGQHHIAYAPDEKHFGCWDLSWTEKSAIDGCDPSRPNVDHECAGKILGHLRTWRGLLRRHTPQARQIVAKLLTDRLTFVSEKRDSVSGFRVSGVGSFLKFLDELLPRFSQAVASPTGFEPVFWP